MNQKLPPSAVEDYVPSHSLLDWMEQNRIRVGDIFRATLYGSEVYVVSDPHFVNHVLRKNWQNYTKGLAIKRVTLLLGPGLISSEGEFWKSQRRLIQPAFHFKVLIGLRDLIIEANAALLRKWERAARLREPVNVTNDISIMVLQLVLSSIFGEDYLRVASSFDILTSESARNLQFAYAFRPLKRVIAEVATLRRNEGRQSLDLLGMLMEARDRDTGKAMSDAQLVTEIMTLIVAGHETTALTLNWCWYLLAHHPEAEHALLQELAQRPELPSFTDLANFPYTGHVIDEALRLYPPVWVITRKAIMADQLGGYHVPAKKEIYFSPYIIQRHPALWPDRDQFNPGRFDSTQNRPALAMLPFSAGPRNCIGEDLARFEMVMHLTMIARSLTMRSTDRRPLNLDLGVNLRNKHDFIMQPTPHKELKFELDYTLSNTTN